MAKRFTDSEKFSDTWYRKLSLLQKAMWEYLLAECNHAGILENFDLEMMSFKIGAEVTIHDLEAFKERIVFLKDNTLFIPKFVEFQYGKLNPEKSKVHKSVVKELNKYSIDTLSIGYEKGIDTLKDKEKDKEKVKVINSQQGRVVNIDDSTLYLNEKEKEKEKLKKEKESSDLKNWHGEYSNVYLSPIQYAKLVQYVGKKEIVDELIEDLSSNIASKRENAPPYDEEFPDMHLAKLKAYWKHRRLNRVPQTIQEKQNEFKAQIEAIAQKYRIEEEKEGIRSG